jgi:outer membrane receptor protein involved in Fe transport
VQLSGDGVYGPDLATIPSIALISVEVLRDGASALYGSDAIAGVFNFNLKDTAEGGEIRLQNGMYTLPAASEVNLTMECHMTSVVVGERTQSSTRSSIR